VTGLIYGSRNSTVTGRYLFTVRPGGGPLAPAGGAAPVVTSRPGGPTDVGLKPAAAPSTGGTVVSMDGAGFVNVTQVSSGARALAAPAPITPSAGAAPDGLDSKAALSGPALTPLVGWVQGPTHTEPPANVLGGNASASGGPPASRGPTPFDPVTTAGPNLPA